MATIPQHRPELSRRLGAAFQESDCEAAERALEGTTYQMVRRINPDAAASLHESHEETLTVARLSVPAALRRTPATTNSIESLERHAAGDRSRDPMT